MADARNLTRDRLRPDGVACTVLGDVDAAQDSISVEWTVFDRDGLERTAGEDGIRWASPAGTLPRAGDDALLLIDDHGRPWALVWATGAA